MIGKCAERCCKGRRCPLPTLGVACPGHAMAVSPSSICYARNQCQLFAMQRILQGLAQPQSAAAHSSCFLATSSNSRTFLPLASSNGAAGASSTEDASTNSCCPGEEGRGAVSRSRITCMQNVEDRIARLRARGRELRKNEAFWHGAIARVRRKPGGRVGYFYVAALPEAVAEILPLVEDVDPEICLALYDKLIRANRLQDCLVLLDNMDKVGILDMNKIYHNKYYDVCKAKKAVREAFSFTLLIKESCLRKYTSLMSVCAAAGDADGALRAFSLMESNGLKADCMIYTALISACAKAGHVDTAFKLFFEMNGAGVEPNRHTFGAMIDGCARVGLLAKAFGVYGIMLSKNIKPDLVIFNTLINACGHAGAIDRAFDVLSDMESPDMMVKPDHVTYGALIGACIRAGQVSRGLRVYKMMHDKGFVGSAEVYTAAVHAHSHQGNLDGAFEVFEDLRKKGVKPDDVFFSALIDVAGQAKKIDVAYSILQEMRKMSLKPGSVAYSAMMGVCSKMKDWQRASDIYQEMSSSNVIPTVSTLNALVNALCCGKLLRKALDVLKEIRDAGVAPDQITYTILLSACERADKAEDAFDLHMSMISEGLSPNSGICDSITEISLRRIQGLAPAPEFSCYLGPLQADMCKGAAHEQWAAWAIAVYRQTISAGVVPTIFSLAKIFGCLRTPESEFRTSADVNGGLFSQLSSETFSSHSMLDSPRIYDPRAMSLYEEAAGLGVVPYFSYTTGPIIIHAEDMPPYVAEVCILTVLKSLKHRLAAGARLQTLIICLPTARKEAFSLKKEKREIIVFGRTGQAVLALLRRLRLPFERRRDSEQIKLSFAAIKNWLQPSQSQHSIVFDYSKLARSLKEQQREIRIKSTYSPAASLDFDPISTEDGKENRFTTQPSSA